MRTNPEIYVFVLSLLYSIGNANAVEHVDDYSDLINLAEKIYKDKIRHAEIDVSIYKHNLRNLRKKISKNFADAIFSDFDAWLIDLLPSKYRKNIKAIKNVEEENLGILKDFTSLKILKFSEYFTYNKKKKVFTVGMLPQSLEEIYFEDFDNSMVKNSTGEDLGCAQPAPHLHLSL